jgi:hypothetical protein
MVKEQDYGIHANNVYCVNFDVSFYNELMFPLCTLCLCGFAFKF